MLISAFICIYGRLWSSDKVWRDYVCLVCRLAPVVVHDWPARSPDLTSYAIFFEGRWRMRFTAPNQNLWLSWKITFGKFWLTYHINSYCCQGYFQMFAKTGGQCWYLCEILTFQTSSTILLFHYILLIINKVINRFKLTFFPLTQIVTKLLSKETLAHHLK